MTSPSPASASPTSPRSSPTPKASAPSSTAWPPAPPTPTWSRPSTPAASCSACGVAATLGTGVIAVRKAGKLPPPVVTREYDLEYGKAALEIPADGVALTGRRVLLLDDVLATGGTLAAAADLFTQAGAEIVAAAVVLELEALGGRKRQGDYPLSAIVTV